MLPMLPQFTNPALLETALTHRSALNEPGVSGTASKTSNERLEFLGDAVLELIVTRFLFEEYPSESEGVLTAYRSALVRTETLAKVAVQLKLGEKLYLSKGEEASGGRTNQSLLADTLEAVIGAVYLDQGYAVAREFVAKHLFSQLSKIKQEKLYKDAKSLLQELVQAQGLPTPEYELVQAEGPDHAKQFQVLVKVGELVCGKGVGGSKQQAQQQAAREAVVRFEKKKQLV